MELQTLVEDYLTNQTSENFEKMYNACKGIIKFMVAKNNYPDKSELEALAEDTLIKCLRTYKVGAGVKFSTYFSRSVANAYKNLYRNNINHLSTSSTDYINDTLNSSASGQENNIENILLNSTDDSNTSRIEVMDLLDSLSGVLTKSEIEVCRIVACSESLLTKKEIATQMSLTQSGVAYLFKAVAKKISRNDILGLSKAKTTK